MQISCLFVICLATLFVCLSQASDVLLCMQCHHHDGDPDQREREREREIEILHDSMLDNRPDKHRHFISVCN